MNLVNEKNLVGKILSLGALVTLLIVTPWATIDPINVPKFAVLAIIGAISLVLLVKNYAILLSSEYRWLTITAGTFLIALFSAFASSSIDLQTQLFGVNGRNTGLITYLSLLFLFIAAAALTQKGFEKKITHTMIAGGVLSVGYGLIQSLKLDPASWVNPYSPVIGFLGNPNFQSSFIGITCVAAVSLTLKQSLSSGSKVALGFFSIISIYVIFKSDAQQGYLVVLAGLSVVFGIYIYLSSFSKFISAYILVLLIGFLGVAFGSLNKGPLASILYKESVTYRGDYWRAGWKITTENPFFGVGLDGYGDWYRRARTIEATLRRGPDVTSNAAHNVLLDLSSNGGFPLLFSYLAMMILVLFAIIKVLRKKPSFDPYFAALVGSWVAYNAQSIISLNQIGLAVWGWLVGGAIIGYSIYGSDIEVKERKLYGRLGSAAAKAKYQVSAATSLVIFIGLGLGAIVGLPPYLASSQYRFALESGDGQIIQKAAYIKPLEITRLGQVAATLRDNKLEAEALAIIQDAVSRFPDAYDAWKILASLSVASKEQRAEALAQMKRLDPNNPELK